ncbi:MAG: hypothetical protein M1827_005697 [Pycnora praestabilis]|nr:MAG: hypothetical protein M1827_005697 [Pycnora praestabilis]
MDISGLVSYDLGSRQITSSGNSRGIMAPQYDMNMSSYSNPGLGHPMPFQAAGYSYGTTPSNNYHHQMASSGYSNSYPQHPHPFAMANGIGMPQAIPQVRDVRNNFPQGNRSPPVKREDEVQFRPNNIPQGINTSPINKLSNSGSEVEFATDVDTLMKAIQTKSQPAQPVQPVSNQHHYHHNRQHPQLHHQHRLPALQQLSPQLKRHSSAFGNEFSNGYPNLPDEVLVVAESSDEQQKIGHLSKKRYECNISGCSKSFFQKTHLEIHTRAHTGVKPFTHERRHTGERPYECEICGKKFAQRGNVRAHKIVHEQAKPFICRLEDCGKQFTQLGNLKSHQNKFHTGALRDLTQKFATMREGDPVSVADKELWEYFANLYKNSNKGIKGRGKDRRISSASDGAKSVRSESDRRGDRSASSMSSSCSSSQHGGYNFSHTSMEDDGNSGSSYQHQHQEPQPQRIDGYDHGARDLTFADRKMY